MQNYTTLEGRPNDCSPRRQTIGNATSSTYLSDPVLHQNAAGVHSPSSSSPVTLSVVAPSPYGTHGSVGQALMAHQNTTAIAKPSMCAKRLTDDFDFDAFEKEAAKTAPVFSSAKPSSASTQSSTGNLFLPTKLK